jgi:mannose-6-phosphate isomerase-like protein (cupin superfamily)
LNNPYRCSNTNDGENVVGIIKRGGSLKNIFKEVNEVSPITKTLLGPALLINLGDWFKSHPMKEGQTIQGEKIFESPGSSLTFVVLKDPIPAIGRHMHANSDEIIMVYKGTGEMNINGRWIPVKAGDLHVCPRGEVHATRAAAGDEMWMIGIYTPPLPSGGDRIMVET